jgi:hypothetical protein
MIISSRLWLYSNGKRVLTKVYNGNGSISAIEKYWETKIDSSVQKVGYDSGQLVIHIHECSSYDVWLPFSLQKKLTDYNIEIRFVFWGIN